MQTEFRFDFRKGPRQISAGPGWSTPEEVEPNFLFCKPNFLFRFGSIDREKCAGSVGDSPHHDVQKDYREVNLCLLLDWPIAIANREARTLNVLFKNFVRLITKQHESQTHPRIGVVRWWSIRLTTDFSGWQSIIAFLYFFLFRSLLRLTFLLSPNKQNKTLNFGLPAETQSRMLARPSRSTRQHPGRSLSLCSAHLDAQFDKTLRRTSVDKLN